MKSQIFALLLAVSVIAAPQLSQASPFGHGHGHGYGTGMMGVNRLEKMGIQLTPAQKAQMEQIQANTKSKIEAVLTREQRQSMQSIQATRQNMQLSADQKQKLRQSWQESRQQMKAILTPEQQQQLQQKRQGHKRGGWHGRGANRTKGPMDLAARLTAQGIQLSPEQQSKLAQLQSQKKATMATIYTPEQQQAFQNMKAQRQSLQLTAAQQEQMRTIRQAARQQMKAVLTAEQQQQLQQKRQQHGWGRAN